MRRATLLVAAYCVDQAAGDPEWLPHPVRLIGAGIDRGERLLRRKGQGNVEELLTGAALTLGIVCATYWAAKQTIRVGYKWSPVAGVWVEVLLGWTCLAARNLGDETHSVTNALAAGDLELARAQVSRIVGRDTAELHAGEVSRAVIEMLAESASDGVIAPMFYMALGGVPLAMAYKAVNTLDSMIGHADEHHFWFGKFAARLDDLANFVPARMTAMAIVAAALLRGEDFQAAWRVWLRDGAKHKSPNAGQPESAMAGALHVRLGGVNRYSREVIVAAGMGEEFSGPAVKDAARAISMVAAASLIGLGCCCLLAAMLRTRRHA